MKKVRITDGVPPEFRVYATLNNVAIPLERVDLNIKLTRLGNVIDDINFYAENDYLRGDTEIVEPHSFVVTVTAQYEGKTHSWSYENFEGRTRIASEMAEALNISTEVVSQQTFHETLQVYGKLTLAPSAKRNISARFPGEVKKLFVELGQAVKKGQLLARIESNESLQNYEIQAPIGGVVTAQYTTSGEQAKDNVLLTITDTSELIAELGVFPMDLDKVKPGAAVRIKVPDQESFTDAVLFDSLFEVGANQAKIFRARINNQDGIFSPGQFVSGLISLDKYEVPLAVKTRALQPFRDFTVVYAKIGETYEVRMLELGRRAGTWVEVLNGIPAGTDYVVDNSYLIAADIGKSGASHDH